MTGPAELRRIQLLDLLYDYNSGPAGTIPDMSDIFDSVPTGEQQDLWLGTLKELDDRGLVRMYLTMGGFGSSAAQLLDAGRSEVEERRRRRQDPAIRRAVAMRGLLLWTYDQKHERAGWVGVHDFMKTHHCQVGGELLPAMVVHRAAEQMAEDGLLEGDDGVAELPGPVMIRITRLGEECVESGKGVDQFMRDQRRTNQPSIVTNFNAPVHGSNIGWASESVTQTVSQTGLAGDELLVLVKAIGEALPVLGLTDQQATEVENDVRTVEGELARSEPDKGVVKAMLMRSVDTIVGAGNSALGMVLMGLAKEKLRDAGIPFE